MFQYNAPTTTTPTQAATDNSTKLANTAFVTTAIANAVAGINPVVAVQVATTQASNTSSLTYNNGVNGVGATLTGSINTALTIDGHTLVSGDRLLVKNDAQTTGGASSGAFNGIYSLTQVQTIAAPPILTRTSDYNSPSDINNTGAIPVVNGTANANTSWLLTSSITTVGTNALTYIQFSYSPTVTMTTTTYDPAAIAQQVVGTTASQTLTNKTLTTAALGSSTATTQAVLDESTKVATTNYSDRNAIYPAVCSFRDDFTNASATSVTTATSASFGEQLWAAAQISGGTQTTANTAGSFTNPGQLLITTSTTSGQGMSLYRGSSATAPYGALGSNAGWEAHFVAKLGSTSTIATRIGFCLAGQQVGDAPTNGIYVEYDTANTGNTSTDFTWVTRSASTSSYSTTNAVAADTNFHSFRIRSTVAGTIGFVVDGGTEFTTTTDVPTGNMMLFVQILSRTSGAATLTVDFVSFMSATGRA